MIYPYSLFRYRQVDGRITFRIKPINGSNILLTNVRQMAVDSPPRMLTKQCNIVLMSFNPLAFITFDASFNLIGEDYEELIRNGIPVTFQILGRDVLVEPLNADEFFASY